jgi:hypothetical protein
MFLRSVSHLQPIYKIRARAEFKDREALGLTVPSGALDR